MSNNANRPRYGSWVSRFQIRAAAVKFVISLAVFLLSFLLPTHLSYAVRNGAMLITLMFTVLSGHALLRLWQGRRAMSLDDPDGMALRIIESAVDPIRAKPGEQILDIGCGSGASAVLCAKNNPEATVVGIDRWNANVSDFTQSLCEENARAEGVTNLRFQPGDVVSLDFPSESFDAVISNLSYHHIPHEDRTALLREALRVLKPGGLFSIQDLFGPPYYRDIDSFVEQLKREGITHVQLSPTLTERGVLYPEEAAQFGFQDCKRLSGIK